MKKVLVLPGWMTSLKLYKNSAGEFDMNFGKLSPEARDADYVVGLSMGALAVLKEADQIKGKIILINPLLPKRNVLVWFFQWTRYIIGGLFIERQKFILNPIRWIIEIARCVKLLRIDFSDTLKAFPKDRLTVIKSKSDNYFCDLKALNFLNSLSINVIEIEGGHNWNENTEEEMNKQTII
jgi:hypothetical protein